jgi:hypothetical protein
MMDMAQIEALVRDAATEGEIDKALELLRAAQNEWPYDPGGYKFEYNLLLKRQDWPGIIRALKSALAIASDDIETHFGLACGYDGIGDFAMAQAHYDSAVAIDPHCALVRTYRAYSLLKRGWNFPNADRNWRQGLEDYEYAPYVFTGAARRAVRTSAPMWDGGPIPGKRLYVSIEQGAGDMIWLARWLALVKEVSKATVILECDLPMARLMEHIAGVDMLVNARSIAFRGFSTPFDYHIPIFSLMRVLGVTPASVSDIYDDAPYMKVDVEPRTEENFRVGFCWYGSKVHSADATRSLSFEQIKPLTELPCVIPVNLQFGDPALPNPITGDFLDTARRIASCDLVVTVDTAVAHLAGAMGIPTLMMVTEQNDFRWFVGRSEAMVPDACTTTPWYNSIIICRQKKQGEWVEVLEHAKGLILREGLARTKSGHYPPLTA